MKVVTKVAANSADAETLQALKAAVSRESGIVRSAAARAFARIGTPAVPPCLEMLTPEIEEKTQEWVAKALSQIGSPRWLRFRRCARGSRVGTAACAYGLLWRLAKMVSDAEAVPILMEVLDDEDLADLWPQACGALGAIARLRERPGTISRRSQPMADEIRQAVACGPCRPRRWSVWASCDLNIFAIGGL